MRIRFEAASATRGYRNDTAKGIKCKRQGDQLTSSSFAAFLCFLLALLPGADSRPEVSVRSWTPRGSCLIDEAVDVFSDRPMVSVRI